VVIGGGLTGVDTATEIQAYYIVQVEKMLERYEILAREKGEAAVRTGLDAAPLKILDEFLAHGRAVRAERERARKAGAAPDLLKLIRQWGGVTIAYRKGMNQSPAYTRNHEEITKAFEEGIYYAEGLDPKEARVDRDGQVESLVAKRLRPDATGRWQETGEEVIIPARAILVATGARPNVAYEFEHKGHFNKERGHYQTHHDVDGQLEPIPVAPHCKVPDFGPFTSYDADDRRVSFLGDTHPVFHGSVVKAVASGLRTYPKIVAALGTRVNHKGEIREYHQFRARIEEALAARVESVKRLTPSVVELTVRAPMAAKRFKAGQFFRLQNFETQSALVDGTRLQTEALAMTGARVDPDTGMVSLMVIERGASSRLVAGLKPGEPVALMGPTGVRTAIPHGNETILFIGGRHGAAHVQSTGKALRESGNRVLFVGCFDSAQDVFCQDEIEAAADTVLWITASGAPVKPRRPQDRSVTASVLDGIIQYAAGKLGDILIRLQDVTRVQVTGSNRLVRLIRDGRKKGDLALYLAKNQMTTASISTPMQCCLKGVCSQCLQWQIDPATGKRTKAVFSCSWQDQPLDIVDLDNLDERLSQNQVQEHLTNQWLDYLLTQHKVARV
jgi:NAD(P)H-flavin reductase